MGGQASDRQRPEKWQLWDDPVALQIAAALRFAVYQNVQHLTLHLSSTQHRQAEPCCHENAVIKPSLTNNDYTIMFDECLKP